MSATNIDIVTIYHGLLKRLLEGIKILSEEMLMHTGRL